MLAFTAVTVAAVKGPPYKPKQYRSPNPKRADSFHWRRHLPPPPSRSRQSAATSRLRGSLIPAGIER